MDSYNGVVRGVRNYKAQHVKGGLGMSGNLGVQGAGAGHMSLKDAQARLNALGYPVGKPDGTMGRRTRLELRRYQKAHHLAATGRLNAAAIAALREK